MTASPVVMRRGHQAGAACRTAGIQRPTERLLSGEVGPPLVVISRSEIRTAEALERPAAFETRDGYVEGRAGDIAITMRSGERFPILADVFYGTYEVIGRVGNRMVVRRLTHERRAWPVVSDHAEFDYGDDRGAVSVAVDGWLYQSDDSDFGIINADVKLESHVVVGPLDRVEAAEWAKRFRSGATLLAFMPALLSLLALLALADVGKHRVAFLVAETALLVCGSAGALWMKRDRWSQRAAVVSAVRIAREFQVAVELLGHKPSLLFPGVTLWRAAQGPDAERAGLGHEPDAATSTALRARLAQTVAATLVSIRNEIGRYARTEHAARGATLAAILAIIACNLVLLTHDHIEAVELLSVWLPSLVGALHAFNARRQVVERLAALGEFAGQLKFVSDQLFALVPRHAQPASKAVADDFRITLKLLCRIVGQHSQRLFGYALAEEPSPQL